MCVRAFLSTHRSPSPLVIVGDDKEENSRRPGQRVRGGLQRMLCRRRLHGSLEQLSMPASLYNTVSTENPACVDAQTSVPFRQVPEWPPWLISCVLG